MNFNTIWKVELNVKYNIPKKNDIFYTRNDDNIISSSNN